MLIWPSVWNTSKNSQTVHNMIGYYLKGPAVVVVGNKDETDESFGAFCDKHGLEMRKMGDAYVAPVFNLVTSKKVMKEVKYLDELRIKKIMKGARPKKRTKKASKKRMNKRSEIIKDMEARNNA